MSFYSLSFYKQNSLALQRTEVKSWTLHEESFLNSGLYLTQKAGMNLVLLTKALTRLPLCSLQAMSSTYSSATCWKNCLSAALWGGGLRRPAQILS